MASDRQSDIRKALLQLEEGRNSSRIIWGEALLVGGLVAYVSWNIFLGILAAFVLLSLLFLKPFRILLFTILSTVWGVFIAFCVGLFVGNIDWIVTDIEVDSLVSGFKALIQSGILLFSNPSGNWEPILGFFAGSLVSFGVHKEGFQHIEDIQN